MSVTMTERLPALSIGTLATLPEVDDAEDIDVFNPS